MESLYTLNCSDVHTHSNSNYNGKHKDMLQYDIANTVESDCSVIGHNFRETSSKRTFSKISWRAHNELNTPAFVSKFASVKFTESIDMDSRNAIAIVIASSSSTHRRPASHKSVESALLVE